MKKTVLGGLLGVLFLVSSLWGVAPHPKLIERLKEEGKWEEFKAQYKSWGDYDRPNPAPYHFKFTPSNIANGAIPRDTIRVVVIYAAPSDRPITSDGMTVTLAQLQNILFGTNPTGNMTDYYKEVSYGQTVVIGDVYGPFNLPGTNASYTFGNYGLPASQFVTDAVAAANPTVNFAQYDNDGNGTVDGLFVVHSGPGAEETGRTSDIWSHAFFGLSISVDGKSINSYAIMPEQQQFPFGPIQIGVFCHESGHSLFGLPDLYDIDGSSQGIGVWCLMSSGNYQNGSKTPVHMSGWCKHAIGWVTAVNPTSNQNNVSFPAIEYNPVIYRLWTNGTISPLKQYFLVENRQRKGFDSFLPGDGLLIWHIDSSQSGNTNENRYLVDLEQADGLRHMNLNQNTGDAGDPFPGTSNNRNFDEFSNPNSKTNFFNGATQVAVFNISNSDSVMTANVEVAYGRPRVTSFSSSVSDVSGNNNARPDPGETVDLYFSFTNIWLATSGWNVLVRAKDTALAVLDSTAFISNLPGLGASTSTSPDPVRFSVPADFGRSKLDSFYLYAWNFDSSYTFSSGFRLQIGPTQIVLVDDDHNRAMENFYRAPLEDTLFFPARVWPVFSKGVPPVESLSVYPNLFWFTGNDSASLLNSSRIASLSAYLNAGGHVVLSGQGIAQSLWSGPDSTFLRNYFHCRYKASQTPAVYGVGAPGNPVLDTLRVIPIGSGGANNQTQEDQLDYIDGRVNKVFTYSSLNIRDTTGPIAAIAHANSTYRALFAGFGLEAINSNTVVQGGARRSQIFSKILDWLEAPAPTGFASPYMNVDKTVLSFSVSHGAAVPAPDSVVIQNTGGGTLSWTAVKTPPANWFSLSSDTGTAPSVLYVSIDSTSTTPGSYADTIVISGTGAFNTPRKVTVNYTVAATRGDLDQNGLIQLADIQLLVNCAFLGSGSCGLALADINCDGILTGVDVVLLINIHFFSLPLPC